MARTTLEQTDGDADRALALVIANTRMAERPGARRPHSLTKIAEAIRTAERGYGTQKEIAGRVGISTEMLQRFLSVEDLHPKVKPLVSSRRIDSLNMVHYMASIAETDQPAVAEAITSGRLSGTDVRALAPLRRRFPQTDIARLIDRVTSSRDRTVYAIVFTLENEDRLRRVTDALRRESGEGLVAVRKNGNHHYKAVLSRQGLKNLRAAASKRRLPFRDYMKLLLSAATHDSV